MIIIQFVKMPFCHCFYQHLRRITACLFHHSYEKIHQMRFEFGFFLCRTFNPRFIWHARHTNDTRSDITIGSSSLHWSSGDACSSFAFHAPAKVFFLKRIILNLHMPSFNLLRWLVWPCIGNKQMKGEKLYLITLYWAVIPKFITFWYEGIVDTLRFINSLSMSTSTILHSTSEWRGCWSHVRWQIPF